jgi:hypothetical protein
MSPDRHIESVKQAVKRFSIPGVAPIVHWVKSVFGATFSANKLVLITDDQLAI